MPTTEIWLRSNRRVLAIALVPAAMIGLFGVLMLWLVEAASARVLAWSLIAASAFLLVGLVRQIRIPRLAYRDGYVLFNLRAGKPVAVPREVVEGFLLGQGSAGLPHTGGANVETVNLVTRLSQKAPEWMQVQVKPAIGRWCDGYVTIRGAWCEPLNDDVVRRLNARLRELRTADQAAVAAAASRKEALLAASPVTQPHSEEQA